MTEQMNGPSSEGKYVDHIGMYATFLLGFLLVV